MKRIIVFVVANLILATSSFAEPKTCQPSGIDYRVAVQKSVRYFINHPELTKFSTTSGPLSISVLPEDFKDATGTSYRLTQKVHLYYRQMTNKFGPFVNEYKFSYGTNQNCNDFEDATVEEDLNVPAFEGDTTLSKVALIALDKLSSSLSNMPLNNHSGSHSLMIRVPTLCAVNSPNFNVLIQRTHMVAGRTVSRIFKYVINSETGEVIAQSNIAGWFLDHSCSL